MNSKVIKYQLTIEAFKNRDAMGKKAANDAGNSLRRLLNVKEEINCIFAAAPSQNEFLANLVEEKVEWNRINAFHMDEYIGLKNGDKRSFSSFLKDKIFDRVNFKNVYCLSGDEGNIEAEIARYTTLLKEYPVDITFMGIGENGHIAFNDPHVADFRDKELIKKVDLDQKCRVQQVHDGCFDSINEVPQYALTLTIPALIKAEELFCIVPGVTKCEAVKNTVYGELSEKCPATILRKHHNARLYLDADSSKGIV